MKNYLSNSQNRLKILQEIELSILMLLACCYSYLQVQISSLYWLLLTFFGTILAPFTLSILYKTLEKALLFFFKFLNILSKGSGELLTLFYKEGKKQFFEKHNNFIIKITKFKDFPN